MLFECVPNFSEGRDERTIEALAEAALTVRGVALLDVHRDADHNRCVLTLAGEGEALFESVFRATREAVSRIDLTKQRGEHPRAGAADVIPFVPLEGASMEAARDLAVRTGERIARELSVPVYLYEEAARRPERRALPDIRNQGFEELARRAREEPALWRPDLGPAELHATAGASCVGARFFLVAWNVDLESDDLALASSIAKAVRESSGGLPGVRAKGFRLPSRSRVQVSLNLVDYRKTSVARALREVERAARERKVEIARCELVGLIPREALDASAAELLRLEDFSGKERVLEQRLAAALPPSPAGELARYLEAIASPAHSPGGGSAGALAAALGRACLEKARLLSSGKGKLDAASLARIAERIGPLGTFLELAARDERAFADLAASWSLPKADPGKKAAADEAIAVDLGAARAACDLAEAASQLAREGNPNLTNDAALAAELALACVRVARWNALATRKRDAALRSELDALLARAEAACLRSRSGAEPTA